MLAQSQTNQWGILLGSPSLKNKWINSFEGFHRETLLLGLVLRRKEWVAGNPPILRKMKQRQVTPKEIHTRVYSERDIRCLDWNNQSFMMSTPKRHMMPPTYAWLESHIYPSHLLCNVWYPRRTIQWLISIHASISLCRRSHTLDTNHQSRSLATCNRYSALPTSSHSEVDGVGFIVSWWLYVYYIYRDI